MPTPDEYALDPLPKSISKPTSYAPQESYQLDPLKPQTAWGREEIAKQSMAEAAASGQAVLENLGMVGATMLVPQAAIPAAIAKYGPAARLVYQASLRTTASGIGRASMTAAGQELKRQMAPETAPSSPEMAWSEQWASAKEGALQQGVFGEIGMPAIVKGAAATVEALPKFKLVQGSKVVSRMAERVDLLGQQAAEMQRLTEGAAKQAAMAQARNDAEQIAADMGSLVSKETGKSQAGQLKTAIENSLNKTEKARYLALDKAAAVSMKPDGAGKVDTQPIVDRFVELAKQIPVGSGFWREWSKLPPDVATPLRAALAQDAKIAKGAADVEAAAMTEIAKKGGSETPRLMPAGASEAVKDLVTAMNDLANAQKAHGATPVSVLLRARAAMSRAKADPTASDDLVAILEEMIPRLNKRVVGPVDKAIGKGLYEINPVLSGEFEEARQYWHQAETMKRMVLYKIFQKNGDAQPLANYIGPNDPQAVTRVRVLLQDIGQEAQWPSVQREVFTNLILGRNGDVDLMGLSRRLDDWGSSTISQLTRAGTGARDAVMVSRVDSLRNLSEKYTKLMNTEEPVLTSRRLEQIDMMLKKLEGGDSFKDTMKSVLTYAVSPHVIAGASMGYVFGWKPALVGGITSAAAKSGADAMIRLAYDPVRLNRFVTSMEAFVKNGDATSITNMARLAEAAMKSVPAAKAMGGAFSQLLQSSHAPAEQ